MALSSYLRCTFQSQGEMKGSVTQKGLEGSVEVIAFSHELISPRDAASGLPTGKRMHKPIVITKRMDCASPQFWNALVNNENITKWEMKCYQPEPGGTTQNFFTINLEDASVASIQVRQELNKNPDLTRYEIALQIAFTYRKITWTNVKPTTVVAMDDWGDFKQS
jgi:type VI secretion system secreted protein Hcp